MTTLEQAARQALEALEVATTPLAKDRQEVLEAIASLRQALEQPKQEPEVWIELLREARENCKASIVEQGISASRKEYRIGLQDRLTAALGSILPKREWVVLTKDEILAIGKELGLKCRLGGNPNIDLDYAEAIEAALKEKNFV